MANPDVPSAPRARAYGGASHEERLKKRRAQFVAAGKHLFGTAGYRRTTVRGLCREAGLTDRYFYESFATTEDLLVAVYEQLIADMQGAVMAALMAAPPDAGPQAWVDRGLEAFFTAVEDAEAARIVWLEVLGVSPRVDALYNQTLQQFADLLLTLVRSAHPAWPVDDEAAPVVALGAIGAASEAAKSWLMSGYRQPRSALVRGIAVIFHGAAQLPPTTAAPG